MSRTARIVLVAAAAASVSACGVNTVPTKQEAAKAAWAQVQNDYQRRADLIPNLVSTVKAAGAQEKDILTEVTQARASANQIKLSGEELGDPDKMAAFQSAQAGVTLSLQRLQEAYPELKSQANYTTLMSQLEGTENRITVSRRDYNLAVQDYNTTIRTFPSMIGAKFIYSAKPMTPFQAVTPGAETAPQVKF
jgi:LemA protein